MTHRRTFLKASALGALLGALGDARSLFAEELGQARGRGGGALLPTADDYLLEPGLRYLNHGSIGTLPRIVHEAHTRYLRLCESNPWLYMWDAPWVEPKEEVRRRAAALLGCEAEEVALTHNTTEAFNLMAQGLDLAPGDEVLFSSLNHPGASLPWEHHAPRRGYSVRQFEIPLAIIPELTESEVVDLHLQALSDRTRVLVLPHVDNTVGLRHPVEAIARAARARGVEWIAVDGAQALSMLPVDLASGDIDLYAACPHKWVQAPKGLGLLYVRKARQDALHPMWVSAAWASHAPTVRRFEDYGTRNLPELMTLGDALAFQASVDPVARERHHAQVWAAFRDAVEATPGFRWRSPTQWSLSAALYLVEVEGIPSGPLFRRLLAEEGLVFRAFRTPEVDGARLSPNLQTPFEDLTTFLERARG
jgi:isopenicillin-N epimerase